MDQNDPQLSDFIGLGKRHNFSNVRSKAYEKAYSEPLRRVPRSDAG